jgi:hypothetical protein
MVADYNKKELYSANEKLLPLIREPWTIHGYYCHHCDNHHYCESFSSNSIHLVSGSQKMLYCLSMFISNMWKIMILEELGYWEYK